MSNSIIICTYFNDYCHKTIIIIPFNYTVKSIRATVSEILDCLVVCTMACKLAALTATAILCLACALYEVTSLPYTLGYQLTAAVDSECMISIVRGIVHQLVLV